METNAMYTNRIELATNDKEAVFIFKWMTPILDENGNNIGANVERTQTVTMNKEALAHIAETIRDVLKAEPEEVVVQCQDRT